MKKGWLFSLFVALMLMSTNALAVGGGGGGGGGNGGGSSGGGGTAGFAGVQFSEVRCFDDGSISFYMQNVQKITAIKKDTNKATPVSGEWDAIGNFKSNDYTLIEAGEYNITNNEGITRTFTCPAFKFACSLVKIQDITCIKNSSGIFASFKLINESNLDNIKFNFLSGNRVLTYSTSGFSSELKDLKVKQEGEKFTLTLNKSLGDDFEVVHTQCIGKYYIYAKSKCTQAPQTAEAIKFDPNALKCGGLLDIKDRVRCRINLEKPGTEYEYENFYPEECKTHANPGKCYNLYKSVSPCWNIPNSNERISCLDQNIALDRKRVCASSDITCKKDLNEKLLTIIKLRFYNLEQQAEMLADVGVLDKEDLINFVVEIENKKKEFNQIKTKEEMKKIIQDVRTLWTDLMSKRKI